MYRKRLAMLIMVLVFVFTETGTAQVVIDDLSDHKALYPGKDIDLLRDSTGELTALELLNSQHFKKDPDKDHSRGVHWVRFDLTNRSQSTDQFILTHHLTSFVAFYQFDEDSLVYEARAGEMLKKKDRRPNEYREHIDLRLKAGVTYTLLIRLENTKDRNYNPPIRIDNQRSYEEKQASKFRFNFALLGAATILVLYLCVLYLTNRYRPYFWLMWFSIFITLYAFAALGYHTAWIIPNQPLFGKVLVSPLGQLAQLFMLLLVANFFHLREQYPAWFKVIRVIMWLVVVKIAVLVFVNTSFQAFGLMINYSVISLMLESLVLIVMVAALWRRLDRSQKILGIGVMFFAITVGVTLVAWMFLNDKGLAAMAGLIIPQVQVLTFTVAIGSKMKLVEAEQSQVMQSFLNLREELAFRIEQAVESRTEELSKKNKVIEARNEKIETLFREANHRVKNNFQLLSSLLSMQEGAGSDSSKMVEDSRNRIITMTVIHQFLYQSRDASTIDFKSYCQELIYKVFEIQHDQAQLELVLDFGEDVLFDLDTSINLGLIVNELVTNTFKYAEPSEALYKIRMELERQDEADWLLVYHDQGPSFDFEMAEKSGFGLRLISRLCRQLKGSFQYRHKEGNEFYVRFKADVH